MPTGQQYSSVAVQAHLTAGILAGATSCTVDSTSGFPSAPFTIVFDINTATQEVCDVTSVSSLTLTITRGVDGSAAQAHSNGATVTHSAIARDLREARAHIDASTSNDSTGHSVHGLASGSSVVGTSDTQTLSNKTLTSPTINGGFWSTPNFASPDITGTVIGGATYSGITLTGTIPSASATLTNPNLQNAVVNGSLPSNIPLQVVVGASQTANSQEWQNSGTGTNASVGPSGIITGTVHSATGITGAGQRARLVGSTSTGPPTSGTFLTGDVSVDRSGGLWICTSGGSPGTFEGSGMMLVSSTTLGSAAATVTFSSIPAYFTSLKLFVMAKSSGSAAGAETNLRVQFNGDTAANYGGRYISIENSTTVTGVANNSQTSADAGFITNAGAGGTTTGGAVELTIPFYSNTNWNKQFTFNSQSGAAAIAWMTGSGGGAWTSTAAINSITLLLADGSNFTSNSVFALYGIP